MSSPIHHFVQLSIGNYPPVFIETTPGVSFAACVRELSTCDHEILEVLEVIPGERSSRPVTEDVARALAQLDWDSLSKPAQALCERFGLEPEPEVEFDPVSQLGTLNAVQQGVGRAG